MISNSQPICPREQIRKSEMDGELWGVMMEKPKGKRTLRRPRS